MKHSILKGTVISLAILLSVIFICYFIFQILFQTSTLDNEQNTQTVAKQIYVQSSTNNQSIGKTQSIINDDQDHAVSVHYPVLGVKAADATIQDRVYKLIDDFQRKKVEYMALNPQIKSLLWIDYESYMKGDTVSVVFRVMQNFSSLAHPYENVNTLVVDIDTGRELQLNDVLQGDYLPTLAALAKEKIANLPDLKDQMHTETFETGIAPKAENYRFFALKEDGLAIYFDKYQLFSGSFGIQSVTIPYEEVSSYLKINLSADQEPQTVQTAAMPIADLKAPPKVLVDKQKPMIALSFDDGPNGTVTPRILDVLKENNARATFFVLGNRVDSFPSIIQREYTDGHEIGSHSFSHPQITTLTPNEIAYQFNETENRLSRYIPYATQLVRPPYGQMTQALKDTVPKTFVLWSVDTQDWKSKNKDAIVNNVLENVKDGDIVLMHDMYGSTADACEELVPKLIEQGYQLVTVSELLKANEITPAAGGVYRRALSG